MRCIYRIVVGADEAEAENLEGLMIAAKTLAQEQLDAGATPASVRIPLVYYIESGNFVPSLSRIARREIRTQVLGQDGREVEL